VDSALSGKMTGIPYFPKEGVVEMNGISKGR
jgi:hypothetical protein